MRQQLAKLPAFCLAALFFAVVAIVKLLQQQFYMAGLFILIAIIFSVICLKRTKDVEHGKSDKQNN